MSDRKKQPIALPTKVQLVALGDAMMAMRHTLRLVADGLKGVRGATETDQRLIDLLQRDAEQALPADV